jgi:tRNA 5-methylaminomethyl-2-thiouridine biosynthesis bifunctional protein
VEKRAGFGTKREMLVARNTRRAPDATLPNERRAIVVGAGLAGAAVCERLCARGWEVDLHERRAEPAQEASGNHAGTFHPIVTPDDSIFARLTRAAYLYALRNWERLPGARYDQCGVLQLARNHKEMEAQRKAVAGLPADYAHFVEREEAAEHAGVPVASAGLWFAESGWIKPRSLVRAQLAACGERLHQRFGAPLEKLNEGTTVILANSAEAPKLCPVPHLRLRRVRGQLTYVPMEALEPPRVVVLRGGMVLPPIDGVCVVGATYDLEDDDRAVREDSHAGNLERLRNILGVDVRRKTEGRVSFRAVTPDRLPVVGKIRDGVYGAFAYGSRGILWSALAAEIIASELEGEPMPLEGKLADALGPARFAKRAESRGSHR